MKLFFVEGNIGSGKSTLLSKIKTFLKTHSIKNVVCIQEPVDLWKSVQDSDGKNILEHFYSDPVRSCYMFQSFAFISRLKLLDSVEDGTIYIMERSILTDNYVFAQNCRDNKLMSEIEWITYSMWFEYMYSKYRTILDNAHMFYIRCSPETSFGRIQKRGREEERNISLDYIRQIHDKHETWLVDNSNTIMVDGEKNLMENENFDAFMLEFLTHIFPRS